MGARFRPGVYICVNFADRTIAIDMIRSGREANQTIGSWMVTRSELFRNIHLFEHEMEP
jgi:hypothetical protein